MPRPVDGRRRQLMAQILLEDVTGDARNRSRAYAFDRDNLVVYRRRQTGQFRALAISCPRTSPSTSAGRPDRSGRSDPAKIRAS